MIWIFVSNTYTLGAARTSQVSPVSSALTELLEMDHQITTYWQETIRVKKKGIKHQLFLEYWKTRGVREESMSRLRLSFPSHQSGYNYPPLLLLLLPPSLSVLTYRNNGSLGQRTMASKSAFITLSCWAFYTPSSPHWNWTNKDICLTQLSSSELQ